LGIIQCTYTSPIKFVHYGANLSMEFVFCWPIEFHTLTKLICLDDHFSKWLELVPMLDHNNEGVAYAFLDRAF
jgi:hypothetical protein